mgnify:CR=1 FL=1|tara:strand:+ start:3950 stop:4711 length:762 start_codon:yes stop_codon:yes gene_type:complete
MKFIKPTLALLGISLVTLFVVSPQIISPQVERISNEIFMSPNERWHDWVFVSSLPSPDNSTIALIETNKHFGSLESGGLIRLSLKSGNDRITVWESLKISKPKYDWSTSNILHINYEEYSVFTFEPEVTLNANDYTVTLNMNSKIESVEDFDMEGWDWKTLENTPNKTKSLLVITERGKHSDAAPIIRYSVADKKGQIKELWQGTEQTTKPTIKWVSNFALELEIEENHLYSFFPSRRFSSESVSVELKIKSD